MLGLEAAERQDRLETQRRALRQAALDVAYAAALMPGRFATHGDIYALLYAVGAEAIRLCCRSVRKSFRSSCWASHHVANRRRIRVAR